MKKIKKYPSILTDLPTPASISFLWNLGFMLGMLLMLQIITGLVLSMSFIQSENEAFLSIVRIMRDSNNGWFNRTIHSNTASLFFMSLFIHLSRGMFYSSYKSKSQTWLSGSTIFLLSMATAFFGYVLPWGQMSYWGATVITNIVSAMPYVGNMLVEWLWGNFSVSQPTLNRFFSIHFTLPFVIITAVMAHILMLHTVGSSNPIGAKESSEKIEFHPTFTEKDSIFIMAVMIALITLIINKPSIFMDPENMNEANPMKAPVHIQPEWYFLFAYAILRSIPSKLGGILALVASVMVIFVAPIKKTKTNSSKFSPKKKMNFVLLSMSFATLTFIGSKPVEKPYVEIGKTFSMFYFINFSV